MVSLVSGALPADRDFIEVTLVNQDPDPAEPGSYVDVRLKFENRGSGASDEITVELIPEFPFSFDTGEDGIEYLGTVHGKQVDALGAIVKYKVRVDADAVEGDNELKVRYKQGESSWIEEIFCSILNKDFFEC